MANFQEELKKVREAKWDKEREAIERKKIHQKRETILFIIATISTLLLLIICSSIQYDKALDNCIKKGFAKNVCIANL